jgi:hypothetical protein
MKVVSVMILLIVLSSAVRMDSRARKMHRLESTKRVVDGGEYFTEDCPEYWLGDFICDADYCGNPSDPNNPWNADCSADGTQCDCPFGEDPETDETGDQEDDGSEFVQACSSILAGDGCCDMVCMESDEFKEAEFSDCCPPGHDSNGVCEPECIKDDNEEIAECCKEEYKQNGRCEYWCIENMFWDYYGDFLDCVESGE